MKGSSSLKDKRRIVKSLIGRLKSRFNLSVAEVDQQDSKTTAVIGAAVVSNGNSFVNQQLDAVIKFIQGDSRFGVTQIEREVFS